MADSTQIEVRDGETVTDALVRMAKEKVASGDVEAPTNKTPSDPSKKAPSKSKKSKVGQGQSSTEKGGDPSTGSEPEPMVYRAVHIYQREGESPEKARHNGMRERMLTGPSTLVFVHLHGFGGACDSSCRAKVAEGDE